MEKTSQEITVNEDQNIKAESLKNVSIDTRHLAAIYEKYYPLIFKFLLHRLFDRETAKDITSSVFLAVARQIKSIKPGTRENLRAWIYAIAANQANAYLRKTYRRKKLLEQVSARQQIIQQNSSDHHQPINWPELYNALSKLKNSEQTVVTLRFFEGLTHKEIAKITSSKPATVRVVLHRSLKKLKKRLDLNTEQE